MNGIIGMVDLLLMTPLTTEQQEYTEIARRSATSLLNLINDILDFSAIEAGKLKLEYTNFHLPDLIRQTLALFALQTCEKKLHLRCELAPDLPLFVRGDVATEQGEVIVEVKRQKAKSRSLSIEVQTLDLGPGTCNFLFSIRDTGIGIPENRQDRLFQVFSQVDASHTRKYGGTGLGLAISKQLVELMGGSIGFESTAGQGSTFWFTASLEPQIPQQPLITSQAPPSDTSPPHKEKEQSIPALATSSPTDSIRLLLVEDNPVNQKLAVRLLKKFGYEIDVVGNGREALAILNHHSYEAILMDCQMPEMDGFEATKEIRRRESEMLVSQDETPADAEAPQRITNNQQSTTLRVPIIALTANAVQGDRERCLEAGMDDYLTKPINPTELKTTLDKWLSHIPTSASV
jgi:CheY-like chemotaxis protein